MFVLAMHAPEIAGAVRAGQFVNLGWSPGPLLRRPFSVYRSDGEHIEVVLKAVGAGTSELLAMEVGDRISCLGPLGHGFDLTGGAKTVALVSGGLGVAPMPLAAPHALAAGLHVTWGHGARTAAELCGQAQGDVGVLGTEDASPGAPGHALTAGPDP